MQAPGGVLTVERLGQHVSHLFYPSRRLYGRKLPPFQPVIPTLCRPPASLVAEIRSGHRLAYPAGKGNAAMSRSRLSLAGMRMAYFTLSGVSFRAQL